MNFTIRSLALGLPGTLMVLCACGGPPSSPAISQLLPAFSAVGWHLARDSATLKCRTLDDAEHPRHNWLIGINQVQGISGYFIGKGSDRAVYYVTVPPYRQHDYRYYRYPRGVTITSGIGREVSGYIVHPEKLNGVWGFIKKNKVWTLFRDPNEGHGKYAVTEILGFNSSRVAVGFYVDRSGADVPFELNVITGSFASLKPPGAASAQATGINGKGDVVGWFTGPSGTKGFILRASTYQVFSYPKSTSTQALGLNWQDQIVGSYVDTSGVTHGFLLSGPVSHPQWQSFDNPKAKGFTTLNGINNHDDLVGNYFDNVGNTHGFLCR
jgi:hypothetical protein